MEIGDTVFMKGKVVENFCTGAVLRTESGKEVFVPKGDLYIPPVPQWKKNFMKKFERRV